jgi:hypothetical protein
MAQTTSLQGLRYSRCRYLRAAAEIDWDGDASDLQYMTLSKPADNSTRRAQQSAVPIPDLPDLAGVYKISEPIFEGSLSSALSLLATP